jgi:hypothetical protein
MDGWMDGWMDVKYLSRIAISNHNQNESKRVGIFMSFIIEESCLKISHFLICRHRHKEKKQNKYN